MARGHGQPRPFMFRWWLPHVLSDEARSWRAMQYGCAAIVSVYAGFFCHAWAAAFIPLGLAGVVRVNVRCPVLVDLPAMMWALLAAYQMQHGWWFFAIVSACLAGATKETAPIFAALWAWSPIPLLGLVVPAVTAIVVKPKEYRLGGKADEALAHPFRTAYAEHRHQPIAWWVLPWGVLIFGLAHPTLQVGLTLLFAYGQCLAATDLVRLYQWAWPVLAAQMFHNVSRGWWLPLVVLHLANPYKGDGM
jgi:hypothetical protein